VEIRSPVSSGPDALQLFLTHRARLLSYAVRLTGDVSSAEDVLQEAWLRFEAAIAHRALDEPVAYLHTVIRNLAHDDRRRRGLRARLFVEGLEGSPSDVASIEPTAEASLIASDELRLVREALEGMPERMRVAVEMHRIRGARLKDIAVELGVSVTTAHQLVVDGVERCRISLRSAR